VGVEPHVHDCPLVISVHNMQVGDDLHLQLWLVCES